ncbi:hypothetical protein GOBAR_AA26037 [Gossypium barbadense]|uniref:Uncharacterized protein n=1 Tax=Gossypium barbadense TaxID=3634 RepID=A0A2P5WUA9_GOSBA|nr:hypothetical protein GOBAR_AA26037 [Gossypium barbadense]
MSLMPSHHMPPSNPVIHHARRESSTLLMPYAETHSLFNIRENKRSMEPAGRWRAWDWPEAVAMLEAAGNLFGAREP